MRMVSKDIKILTTNVRGLRQDLKRKDILDNFKKYDIICLQETHLVQRDLPLFKKEWNVDYFNSGEYTNSRGVMTIINNTFEHKIHNLTKDSDGRFIIIDIEITNLFRFYRVNLYAPNCDTLEWFDSLFS